MGLSDIDSYVGVKQSLVTASRSNEEKVLEFNIETPEYINMDFYDEFRSAYFGKNELYKNYVIDFKNTKQMQSCIFGMLLQLREYIRAESSIHLVNCNVDIKRLFTLTNFGKNFTIH